MCLSQPSDERRLILSGSEQPGWNTNTLHLFPSITLVKCCVFAHFNAPTNVQSSHTDAESNKHIPKQLLCCSHGGGLQMLHRLVLNKNQCGIPTQVVSLRFQSESNWMNYYKIITFVVEGGVQDVCFRSVWTKVMSNDSSNWAFTGAFETRSSQKSHYPNRNRNCRNTKAPCTMSENAIRILQFN